MPNVAVSDLVQRVYDMVDDNSLLYPQSEVLTYVNEALRVLNLFTGFLQTTVNITGNSVINRVWYDTPDPIVIPLRVQFEGTYLYKNSLTKLGQVYGQWTAETTATTGIPVAHWTPVGLTKFGIHPADAIGNGVIGVTGIRNPAILTINDTLPIPNEYTEPLEELTAFSLQLKEGFPLFQKSALLYTKFLSRMKDQARWRKVTMPSYYVEQKEPK